MQSLVEIALAEAEEDWEAETFLESVVEVSELIVLRDDEYEFAHLSFQEYLAAAYVRAERGREAVLFEHLVEGWWKPTVLMYAGMANPTRLIEKALEVGAVDLAHECLQETRKRIDEVLKKKVKKEQAEQAKLKDLTLTMETLADQVTDARYADLECYLKSGEWKKADDETYRLMITEVGKEEGQWFMTEDVLNFPAEPLKVIDELWVKFSDGKFGFSVQKAMYMACGGIPDGRYYEKAWRRFCQRNGWMDNSRSVLIKFDANSPRGHLPGIFWTRENKWSPTGIMFDSIRNSFFANKAL